MQLRRYSQQLAARDAELAALRLANGDLKQRLAGAERRYEHATSQLARGAQAGAAAEERLAAQVGERCGGGGVAAGVGGWVRVGAWE